MTEKSYNFRQALDNLQYLQSTEGYADELFQKIISNMKKYKILVVTVGEIYICLMSDKRFSNNQGMCSIHVTYTEKDGDYKKRICDRDNISEKDAKTIFKMIEEKLKKEKFYLVDITQSSQKKDKYIIKMLKFTI